MLTYIYVLKNYIINEFLNDKLNQKIVSYTFKIILISINNLII